jgi:hypothetical protein
MPDGFETTGRVTLNLETAKQMVEKLDGDGLRSQLLVWAEEAIALLP